MGGRPVWLASISRWQGAQVVPTGRWGDGTLRAAVRLAHEVLGPVGDADVERGFYMCSTLCFHRAVTDREAADLPAGPGGLAGPPGVRIVYESAACPPVAPSFEPCQRRRWQVLRTSAGVLRLPVDDCGTCPSCEARNVALTGGAVADAG